jgi:hypothetical protein
MQHDENLLRPMVLLSGAVVAAASPITVEEGGLRTRTAECQDGTCCPEVGSTCVVGEYQRSDKY